MSCYRYGMWHSLWRKLYYPVILVLLLISNIASGLIYCKSYPLTYGWCPNWCQRFTPFQCRISIWSYKPFTGGQFQVHCRFPARFSWNQKGILRDSGRMIVASWSISESWLTHYFMVSPSLLFYRASVSYDGTVRIWSTMTYSCIQTLHDHTANINCIFYDGSVIASAACDQWVMIYFIAADKP